VKAAEAATKQAEEMIALKRDGERHGDPTRVAALPKIERPKSEFDGRWTVSVRGTRCFMPTWTLSFTVADGSISGGRVRGSVSEAGRLRFTHPTAKGGFTAHYNGTLRGNSGSGTLQVAGAPCNGTFTVTRN
jgi:hypothetical protein